MNFRDVYGIISARGNAKIGKKPCTFVAKDCNFDKMHITFNFLYPLKWDRARKKVRGTVRDQLKSRILKNKI